VEVRCRCSLRLVCVLYVSRNARSCEIDELALSPPGPTESRISAKSLLRLAALGATAAVTIIFVSSRVQPVFLSQTLGDRLLVPSATSDEKAMLAAPWSRLPFRDALATSFFLRDRNAFAFDLVGTGKVGLARALALADVAVREAYRRQVPPALVLGVMLTENDEIKSTARSRQGALGLMQIHPGPWRSALGELFGTNLRNDTTNLRYGIYILSHLAKRTAKLGPQDTSSNWRTALLRYNGCVRGTNTRNCHQYPDAVRRQVQRSARTTCGGRDFDHCVVTPLRLGVRARSE
jgi:soluble lytic murein transglycosylase-like protein